MLLLIGVLVILILIFFAGLAAWYENKHYHNHKHFDWSNDGSGTLIVFAVIVFLVTAITWPCFYLANTSRIASMQAFYNNNAAVYQYTYKTSAQYFSSPNATSNALIDGSIEKLQLANDVTTQLATWRDKVTAYNSNLLNYKAMSRNILIGIYYPKLPSNLKLISIP